VAATRVLRYLHELRDVDSTGVAEGRTLVYRADTGMNEYERPPSGGPATLTDLTDVTGDPGLNKSPVYDGVEFPLTAVTTQEDLDAILASVAHVEWHDIGAPGEPPFLSGFRNTGDPWGHARYRRTLNSTVYLEGTVSNDDQTLGGATWVPIFQFPPDCSPGASLRFLGLANDDSIGKLILWEDGTLVWGGFAVGPHEPIDYVSLGGVSFSVGVHP